MTDILSIVLRKSIRPMKGDHRPYTFFYRIAVSIVQPLWMYTPFPPPALHCTGLVRNASCMHGIQLGPALRLDAFGLRIRPTTQRDSGVDHESWC